MGLIRMLILTLCLATLCAGVWWHHRSYAIYERIDRYSNYHPYPSNPALLSALGITLIHFNGHCQLQTTDDVCLSSRTKKEPRVVQGLPLWRYDTESNSAWIDQDPGRSAWHFRYKNQQGQFTRIRSLFFPDWIVFPLPAMVLMVALIKPLRRFRRSKKGLCQNCGYDLRCSPGQCTECGR